MKFTVIFLRGKIGGVIASPKKHLEVRGYGG